MLPLDPCPNPCNLFRAKGWLTFGGHEQLVAGWEGYAIQQEALVWIAGDNDCAIRSAPH